MFKLIKIFMFSLIIIAVAVGFYIWVQKKALISQFLSQKLNMEVELEDVSLSWGRLSLKQLKLKNHSGATIENAFQGDITIVVNPINLLNDPLNIEKIQIDQPILYLELYNFTGSDNNWSRALNSLPTSSDRTFIIEKLIINDLQFHPIKQSHSKKNIILPKISFLEFEHLGNKNPLTIAQVTTAIFESILFSLTSKAGLGEILNNVQALPKQVLEGTTSNIPLNIKNKFQESVNFLKRKTQETKESLAEWLAN